MSTGGEGTPLDEEGVPAGPGPGPGPVPASPGVQPAPAAPSPEPEQPAAEEPHAEPEATTVPAPEAAAAEPEAAAADEPAATTAEPEPEATAEPEPEAAAEPEPEAPAGEPAPAQPTEPTEPSEPEPPPARARRSTLLVATAAGLAVLSLALGVLAAILSDRLDDERSQREAVQEVSGRFATALLTYDYTDLEGAKNRVLSLSTRKFRREYEAAFTGGLEVLVRETQARSAGTVTEIFVGEIEGDSATTIAVVDAVSRGAQGPNRVLSSYIQLDLVRLEGRWLVDNVTNLNFAQAASPTTTTTAPK